MVATPREFTIDQANALVPALHRLVSKQMLVQDEVERRLGELHAKTGELPRDVTPRPGDGLEVRALKENVAMLLRRFEEGWGEVHAMGGVVKDPRAGLVDFYGRVNGELVWLCWCFGEESVAHYHALDEGFSSRRPLEGVPERHRLLS